MTYRKIYSFITLSVLMFGFQSCSSDPKDEPTPPVTESYTTGARREFCKRYNLPEDKVLSLNNFNGVGEDNIAIYIGSNDQNEATVIICDTLSNKAIYSNFNQIKFNPELEFSMPYGEKKTLPFNSFQICGFAINGNNVAGAFCSLYANPGKTQTSTSMAFLHYHLFYNNGKMIVVELPLAKETLFKRESFKSWYNGGSIFYFGHDREKIQTSSRLLATTAIVTFAMKLNTHISTKTAPHTTSLKQILFSQFPTRAVSVSKSLMGLYAFLAST